MRIAVIADPLDHFKIAKDSTFTMMREAARRGHALWAAEPGDLSLNDGRVHLRARPVEMTGRAPDWYQAGGAQSQELSRFDAVLMRKDPPFDMEYVYSTYLLERAVQQGARVFNDPRAIRDHSEKLAITEFPQWTAPTLVTRDPEQLRAFAQTHGRAVFKLLDGMGGASIFQANANDPNLSVIIETLNQFGARSVMAQRYLPQIAQGDKRILLIHGEVVPFSLARIPKAGEARGNLAAGGTGVAQPLSARDREIAESLAPVLASRGLFLVGLDVIGDCLTEINVTSPTCFREITDQSGFDVPKLFIDQLERAVGAPDKGTA